MTSGGISGSAACDAEVAGLHEGRVVTVRVKLGSLSGVQKDALGWAFDLAKEETPLAEAELVIDGTSRLRLLPRVLGRAYPTVRPRSVLLCLWRADAGDQNRPGARTRRPRVDP